MLIDCVLFNDELDLLELRLRELADVVDHTVVVQGEESFAGLDKPLWFDPTDPRWAAWSVSSHVVPRLNTNSRWAREAHARNSVVAGLVDFADTDTLIFADVDEIPDKDCFARIELTPEHWLGFVPPYFYYYLNLRTPEQVGAISYSLVSTIRQRGGQGLRDLRNNPPQVARRGWHFSYMGGIARIQSKLRSFSHAEYDTDAYRSRDHLEIAIARQRDLFGRQGKFWQVALDQLPAEVYLHQERYQHLLLPEEPT